MLESAPALTLSKTAPGRTDLCPPWCRTTHTGVPSQDGLHEGPFAEFVWSPDGSAPAAPLWQATITSCAETPQETSEPPTVYIDGSYQYLDLDLSGLDRYIAGLTGFLTELQILRGQFATILAGGPVQDPPQDDRPLVDRTTPCPSWCSGGEFEADGRPAAHPIDRFHCSDPQTVDLRLTREGEVELILEQGAFEEDVQVALTVRSRLHEAYLTLAFDEAKTIAARLETLAVLGELTSPSCSLPPLSDVLESLRAEVFEDPGLDSESTGYALGRVGEQGRILVVIPRDVTTQRRDKLIRELLCDLGHKARLAADEHSDRSTPVPAAA